MKKKLVLFGAGKIGRSFIGQLFSQSGYEVVFIDVFKPIIDELNLRGNYKVVIKSDVSEAYINIQNVRGVLVTDSERVIEEIATADILAVSVGQQGLKTILPLLSNGLLKRFDKFGKLPLDIIIAENLRNAAGYFHFELKKILPSDYPIDKLLGLVETSIGKMVPIMPKKDMEADILQVFAEPYNDLILDKKAFKNPIPEVDGLSPKENMKAWVDRKLFIHNLGHAATAYLGYLYNPDFLYLHEALNVPSLLNLVKKTMLQSAEVLLVKYPEEFTRESLTDHIHDLIFRFQNKALGDTIFRVGCDLKRKLAPDDRLAGIINLAIAQSQSYNRILFVLLCACYFNASDENGKAFHGDVDIHRLIDQGGVCNVLTSICLFNTIQYNSLLVKATKMEQRLKSIGLVEMMRIN